MKPVSMPTVSLSTLATGARQLVVQEPLETTLCSLFSVSWLTPNTMVASAFSAGGEMRLSLLLGVEDAGAFHRDVNAEVLPRQFRRVALGSNLDLAVADADRV